MLTVSDRLGPLKGTFMLDIIRHGEVIERIREPNLIVNGAREAMARMAGGDVANRSVTQIAFGTSGTAPAAGDTAITGAFTKNLGSVTWPSTYLASFNFTLGTTEANGMAIMEFGLLTAGNVLFARKVRTSVINKTSDLSFNGSWQIQF